MLVLEGKLSHRVAVIAADTALTPAELPRRAEVVFSTPISALRDLPVYEPSVIVIAVAGPADGAWIDLVGPIRNRFPHVPLLLLVHHGDESVALAALRAGIKSYFRAPYELQEFLLACTACDDYKGSAAGGDSMVGTSAPLLSVRSILTRVAAANSNLLITGETGTGKELAAAFVHQHSQRRGHPMVCLNCAAIPDSLLESELFGYVKGAFTGATGRMTGKLEMAHESTIFFDEVGDMSLFSQSKILRVIDTRDVYPLGGHRPVPVDVRIIAATNQDLDTRVRQGRFRADLLYRLNVAHVHLPPLRERAEDVPSLLRHYLTLFGSIFGRPNAAFTDEALDLLTRYQWPGNIRELRNLVEQQFLYSDSDRFMSSMLPPHVVPDPPAAARKIDRERNDRDRILGVLGETNWNKTKAAAQLKWSRMTLYRKLARISEASPEQTRQARSTRA